MVKSEVVVGFFLNEFQFGYDEIRRRKVVEMGHRALLFQFNYGGIRRSLSEYSESVTSCSNSTMVKSEGAFRSGLGLRVRSSNSTMMKSEVSTLTTNMPKRVSSNSAMMKSEVNE